MVAAARAHSWSGAAVQVLRTTTAAGGAVAQPWRPMGELSYTEFSPPLRLWMASFSAVQTRVAPSFGQKEGVSKWAVRCSTGPRSASENTGRASSEFRGRASVLHDAS